MLEFLLEGANAPFTLSLALLFGLLALEIVALLIGSSLLLGQGDADLDAGIDMGLDAGVDLGDIDLDGIDLDHLDLGDMDLAAPATGDVGSGGAASGGTGAMSLAGRLGIGRMPFMIWLATMCLSFGLSGLALQMGLQNFIGLALPAVIASIPAVIFAVWFTRGFGAAFARLLPQTETQALSERSLGRRRGVVSQGTAARGRPAEVRVTDRYGNAHYLRAEPLSDSDKIAQGTDVLVIRVRRPDADSDGRANTYVLVPLSE